MAWTQGQKKGRGRGDKGQVLLSPRLKRRNILQQEQNYYSLYMHYISMNELKKKQIHMNEKHLESFSSKKAPEELLKP